jgi:heavy metal translocating P-type ATPase
MNFGPWLRSPRREYLMIPLLAGAFAITLIAPRFHYVLLAAAVVGALPTFAEAANGLRRLRITIDVFNSFALVIAFVLTDAKSAGFIALMLVFARLLDSFTQTRTKNALSELLALKPTKAVVERSGRLQNVAADAVGVGESVVVEAGERIPVDGIVFYGSTHVNEAPVTGESVPVKKIVGDRVYSGTLVESGVLKIRATGVGKDSTIERLAELMRQAAEKKSQPEKLADRFASIFLPIVVLLGAVTFIVTRNATMTAALFLVACADDMAVAIPLAITATLGSAARRGVIVKGGARLEALSRLKILVLDKTGTVTYGNLKVIAQTPAPGVDEKVFWEDLARAEKFADHPVGRAVYRAAAEKMQSVADPKKFETVSGAGAVAVLESGELAVGTAEFMRSRGVPVPLPSAEGGSVVYAAKNGKYFGQLSVADQARPEAAAALWRLRQLGVKRIVMFTGDRPEAAARIAAELGIDEYRAGMKPENKVAELEKLLGGGPVAMIGDGVNDAPTLSRADVGIAMGGGTAVAIEAADIVILSDDLSRLPETVELARRSIFVVRSDIAIWAVSNLFGFALVLTGFAGPAIAAFYNFITDFFPLINSGRLFRKVRSPR